jgi:hypothetical protein
MAMLFADIKLKTTTTPMGAQMTNGRPLGAAYYQRCCWRPIHLRKPSSKGLFYRTCFLLLTEMENGNSSG